MITSHSHCQHLLYWIHVLVLLFCIVVIIVKKKAVVVVRRINLGGGTAVNTSPILHHIFLKLN